MPTTKTTQLSALASIALLDAYTDFILSRHVSFGASICHVYMPRKSPKNTAKPSTTEQAAVINKEYREWLKVNYQYIKHELKSLPQEKREDRLKEIYGPKISQDILTQFADELKNLKET